MKRKSALKALIFAFVLMLGNVFTPIVAKADIILYPTTDFYKAHSSQCRLERRYYTVNSESGSLASSTTPLTKDIFAEYQNGEKLWVDCIYKSKNGDEWGLIGPFEGYDEWIPMDQMKVVYDNTSFVEEHKSEFYSSSYDEVQDYDGKSIIFWQYPNSGIISYQVRGYSIYGQYGNTYKDPMGRVWVYVGYYQLQRGWICVDDPCNKDLSSVGTQAPEESTQEPIASIPVKTSAEPASAIPEGVSVSYKVNSNWGSCLQGEITIQNDSDKTLKDWTLTFDDSNKITSLWVASLVKQDDGKVTVKCPAWDSVIEPGKSAVIHFIQTTSDKNSEPVNFALILGK